MHPKPAALRPTPYTLPTLCTLNPPPYTLHPKPATIHHTPYTVHREAATPHPTPCNLRPAPANPHPSSYTLHPEPATLPQHAPHCLTLLARLASLDVWRVIAMLQSGDQVVFTPKFVGFIPRIGAINFRSPRFEEARLNLAALGVWVSGQRPSMLI